MNEAQRKNEGTIIPAEEWRKMDIDQILTSMEVAVRVLRGRSWSPTPEQKDRMIEILRELLMEV